MSVVAVAACYDSSFRLVHGQNSFAGIDYGLSGRGISFRDAAELQFEQFRHGQSSHRDFGLGCQFVWQLLTYGNVDNSDRQLRNLQCFYKDVEKIYPEVVATDKQTGFKSITYDHLVAPLIEAVKALYTRLTSVEGRLAGVQAELTAAHQETAAAKASAQKAQAESEAMKVYLCSKDPAAPFCH